MPDTHSDPQSHICLPLVTDMPNTPLQRSEHLLEHAHSAQAIKRRLPTERIKLPAGADPVDL